MIKKTIKYTDFDGNNREEDFFFNLSKAEVAEMELGISGGLSEMMKRLVASQDTAKILEVFKTFLKKSYGVKSPDGKRFVKSQEIWDEFEQTEAYSELFMELIVDASKASEFMSSIIPNVLK